MSETEFSVSSPSELPFRSLVQDLFCISFNKPQKRPVIRRLIFYIYILKMVDMLLVVFLTAFSDICSDIALFS